MDLQKTKEYLERIAGSWNGDEDTIQGERASIANDGIKTIDRINGLRKLGIYTTKIEKELRELLEQL